MSKRNFLESNNPMLKDEVLKKNAAVLDGDMVYTPEAMTVQGAVNKTFALFGILLLTSVFSYLFYGINPGMGKFLVYGGFIGGAIISFIAGRNLPKASTWAPAFAAFEGLAVGGLSAMYAYFFDGIIFQAVTLTFAILFTMLMLYKSGMIQVTERFRSIIMTAMGAIMLVYLVEFVLHLVGVNVPFLHDQSPIGIGISMIIVIVASLKLLIDFDNFDKGEQMRVPNYMEWYFGMGLLFTLVWLYVEILYLLSYFMGSD